MTPTEEAAAILAHYFRSLAGAAGRGWSRENSRDILRAAQLLTQADETDEQGGLPSVPTYRETRATTVNLRRPKTDDDKAWLKGLMDQEAA